MSVRARRTVACAAASLAGLVLVPAAARAAPGAQAIASFPAAATVGQIGLAGSIELVNRNTTVLHDNLTNSVCHPAEASAPCASPERGIVLIPSCGALSGLNCVGPDPGVFGLSATGVGKAGSDCAGMGFKIAVIDPAFGTVRFTPQPAGARVMLPGTGASCEIGFTFSVLKSPTVDSNPAAAGVQTAQMTEHRQYVGL
ncbi:MAG: hypothetical protein M3401_16935, partial [Actinomycetota bacterium]|nr:hypothetical protein [Actinomycetota bacterium]